MRFGNYRDLLTPVKSVTPDMTRAGNHSVFEAFRIHVLPQRNTLRIKTSSGYADQSLRSDCFSLHDIAPGIRQICERVKELRLDAGLWAIGCNSALHHQKLLIMQCF